MKKLKEGVSLIVLIITIAIMSILAGAIIINLSNSKIIDSAKDAVSKDELQNVRYLATLALSDAYVSGKTTQSELQAAVDNAMTTNNIDTSKYTITVTTSKVSVELK